MTTTQSKIKNVSLIFRWIFTTLMIIVPLIYIQSWISAPATFDYSGDLGFSFSAIPKGVEVLHPLSLSTKMICFLIGFIPVALIEFILYTLIKLFRLYENAEIFSLQNIRYIQQVGYALLITQPMSVICDGILSLLLSFENPHGFRYLKLNVSGTNISLLLTAVLIILISWIMAEGHRLREEQQLTI